MTTRTFDTPDPVRVHVTLQGGRLHVVAADTDVSVVTVKPSDASSDADLKAAEQTAVTLERGVLRVATPKRRGLRSWIATGPSSDVTIDVPLGSHLEVEGWIDVEVDGPMGDVVVSSAMGSIAVRHASTARLKSAMGDIRAGHVDGSLDARTAAGVVTVGHAGGTSVVRSSAGDVSVDVVDGPTDVKTAFGDVTVGRVASRLAAKTSAGSIRVRSALEGSVQLESAYGEIEVGIPEGTAAWLDVDARVGSVHTELAATGEPAPDDRTVEVRAHTQFGDVRVVRSAAVGGAR